MKQLVYALQQYSVDNDGRLPTRFVTSDDLRLVLRDYVKAASLFSTLNPAGGEIVPNRNLAGLELESIAEKERTLIVFETKQWKDGETTIGFMDGHITRVTDFSHVLLEPRTLRLEVRK